VNEAVRADSMKNDIIVYGAVLAIAGLQILLAYAGGTFGHHVIEMLGLATVQAALGILFCMHLFREKKLLVLTLILSPLLMLLLMNAFWTDSFRIIQMRPWAN
jgi:hypothetical protein